jgi:hypothetical protein
MADVLVADVVSPDDEDVGLLAGACACASVGSAAANNAISATRIVRLSTGITFM